MDDRPEVRYAKSGELSIAFMEHGSGPLDIVYIPGFVSNCDLIWEVPFYRQIVERLGTIGRVITFDKRGTGLSERTLGHGSVAERMDDIRAVMDAAGSTNAALVGISEGGPLAVTFAATYPDRVCSLVLWATYARCLVETDYLIGMDPEQVYPSIERIVSAWGTGRAIRFFLSGIPEDPATMQLMARYERASATPAMVGQVLRQNVEIDVRSALPAMSASTLVLHRSGDRVVPPRLGRYVADHVEGARWCELAGGFHVNGSRAGERDSLDVIEEFLTGTRRAVAFDRVLATVLFTDIVDSTVHADELGDRRWREVLDAHDTIVRRELALANGREVNTTGDGFFAIFDGPARGSVAPRRSLPRLGHSASSCAPGCTPASAKCAETMSPAWPCTSGRGLLVSPPAARCSSLRRCATWSSAPISSSRTGAGTSSRASRVSGRCWRCKSDAMTAAGGRVRAGQSLPSWSAIAVARRASSERASESSAAASSATSAASSATAACSSESMLVTLENGIATVTVGLPWRPPITVRRCWSSGESLMASPLARRVKE